MASLIRAALGQEPSDLVLKNARYLNVFSDELLCGDIAVHNGYFAGIGLYRGKEEIDCSNYTVIPSLTDSHIHLESAMVSPYEFARTVLPHGTTAVIADPHEIANVLGADGLDYMLQATRGLPLDIYFMAPSCVPATPEEENGAVLTCGELRPYLRHPRFLGLGEMMHIRGVLEEDPEVIQKISSTLSCQKQVDGHAPGLHGKALSAYLAAGIHSDHESLSAQEALEKLRSGMWVMIREGTAAKNLSALMPLFSPPYHARCTLATDDIHPDDLLRQGHIDAIIRKAIRFGADPRHAIKMASYNAAQCFRLPKKGAIAPGYHADFILTPAIDDLEIAAVYKQGKKVYDRQTGLAFFPAPSVDAVLAPRVKNTFYVKELTPEDFQWNASPPYTAIELIAGQIATRKITAKTTLGLAKLAVVERHRQTGHIGKAFLAGYGLQKGALATSVSHDSHNLIVAGVDEADMALAANRVRENKGGLAIAHNGEILGELPLPIAGLLCEQNTEAVDKTLHQLGALAHSLGVPPGIDPFMTLAFVSLPVIPEIRLTTKGLVEVLSS